MHDDIELPTKAELAEWAVENEAERAKTFCITHHYDIGNQAVFVERAFGEFDLVKAAVYVHFMAEEWFGNVLVSNLGIAAALCRYYGCKHAAVTDNFTSIDMYRDRSKLCGANPSITDDATLHREGLREFIEPFAEKAG
jgi:hypothetical protein